MPDEIPTVQPGNILTSKTVTLSTYLPLAIALASLLSPNARAVVIGLLVDNLEAILGLYASAAILVRYYTKGRVVFPVIQK